ncbi:unnamed protein product, partial [Symbiodinium sp. CCMP2456]
HACRGWEPSQDLRLGIALRADGGAELGPISTAAGALGHGLRAGAYVSLLDITASRLTGSSWVGAARNGLHGKPNRRARAAQEEEEIKEPKEEDPHGSMDNRRNGGGLLGRGAKRERKSVEEKEAAEKAWRKFQEEMQATFVKERANYRRDVERIEQDMRDNQDAQIVAFKALQEAIANPDKFLQEEDEPMEDGEGVSEWNDLLRACEETSDETLAQSLAASMKTRLHAMMAAAPVTPQRPRTTMGTPRTPPPTKAPSRTTSAPMLEAMLAEATKTGGSPPVAEEPTALNDPYPPPEDAAATPPSTGRARMQRMPLKTIGRAPLPRPAPGSMLAKKLEAKRHVATESLDLSDEEVMVASLGAQADADSVVEYYDIMDVMNNFWTSLDEVFHVETWSVDATRYYDIIDVTDSVWTFLGDAFLGFAAETAPFWAGCLATLQVICFFILGGTLVWQGIWKRPFAGTQSGRGRASWVWPLLAFAVFQQQAGAVPVRGQGTSRSIPGSSEIELWSSGLMTMREQLAAAEQRTVLDAPLHSGGVLPSRVHADGPPTVEPQPPPDVHDVTHHISFRLLSPAFESESLDLAMEFPLNEERLLEFILESAYVLDREWMDEAVFTEQQIHEDFGTVLILPRWLDGSERIVILIDGTAVGGGLFATYFEGPVTRFAILRRAECIDEDVDIFPFGALHPLLGDNHVPGQHCGVVKLLQRGAVVDWPSPIRDRFMDPDRWRPSTDHPPHADGKYIGFQSELEQHLHLINRQGERDPIEVASAAFDRPASSFWLRAPTQRPHRLYWNGKRLHSIIAVVPSSTYPRGTFKFVMVDMRGIGGWVQWVAVRGHSFDVGAYLEDIQVEYIQGYSLVVQGGTRSSSPTTLRVEGTQMMIHQARLVIPYLALLNFQVEAHQGGQGHLVLLAPSQYDVGGRGDVVVKEVSLYEHLGPPTYDMNAVTVDLPHGEENLRELLRPWAPDWLNFDLGETSWQPSTVEAFHQLTHWSDLLNALKPGEKPTAHIYTDGSWNSAKQVGGYAVAILLCTSTATALFGVLGDQVQGNAPPALQNEQIALAVSLLWLLQGAGFLQLGGAHVHFDCVTAGWATTGAWAAPNRFAQQTHALELLLQEIYAPPPVFHHVAAHVGHPYNEFVDVLAKRVSEGVLSLPRPPEAVCRIFQDTDWSLAAVAVSNLREPSLPFFRNCLQWNPEQPRASATLRKDQLVPTKPESGVPEGKKGEVRLRAFTLNAQSLTGKHRFYEEQLDELQVNVAFFQQAKGQAGVVKSASFLRLSTAGQRHWGTAIWLSRQRGIFLLDGGPCVVEESNVRVVHESPRLLIVVVDVQGWNVVLLAGHCPHAGRPAEAESFVATHVTGDLPYGDPDKNGELALGLARAVQLWFPSTFRRLHVGESATYRQANGADHRIDYIVLGGAAETFGLRSWVEHLFDTMNANDDHYPVCLDVKGLLPGGGRGEGSGRVWRPAYDTEKILTIAGKRLLNEALQSYQQPRWEVHPGDHCQHLQDFLHATMERLFNKASHGPRAQYISEETWRIRERKLWLKSCSRGRSKLWSDLVVRAFWQWRCQEDYEVEALVGRHGLLYEVVSAAVRFATMRIKKNIYKEKADFLKGLATTVGDKAGDILKTAKKLGLGGKSAKEFVRPLPILLDENGKATETWKDRDKVWQQHFGKQEFGAVVPIADLLARDTRLPNVDDDLTWSVHDLPSFFEVEDVFRSTSRRKAPGLDGIPPEILAVSPTRMAKLAHPLMVKAAAFFHQPLQWRGGLLHEMWKRSGSQASPDSYRPIFISSHLGKSYHRLLRNRAMPYAARALHI